MPEMIKLGEFVKYNQTGFHIDCNKEKQEKLKRLGLNADFSDDFFWISKGADLIIVSADSALMIHTHRYSPDKNREITVRPRVAEDEAIKVLDLPIVCCCDGKWDINWDIFKQISEEVVGERIKKWMKKNLEGRILDDSISVSYNEHTGEIEISVIGTDFSRDDVKAMRDQLQLAHLSWSVHAELRFIELRIKAKLEVI